MYSKFGAATSPLCSACHSAATTTTSSPSRSSHTSRKDGMHRPPMPCPSNMDLTMDLDYHGNDMLLDTKTYSNVTGNYEVLHQSVRI